MKTNDLAGVLLLIVAAARPLGAVQDTTPPRVTAVSPAPHTWSSTPPASVVVTFNEAVDPASVGPQTVQLFGSGGDRTFDDGNEILIVPTSVSVSGPNQVTLDLTGVVLPVDAYQVFLSGHVAAGALSFDGSDDVANAGQWLSGTSNTVTMECWARPLGSGASDGNLVIHRAHNNDTYLAWAVATSTFEFSISLNEKAQNTTTPISFGGWHHVAGTYDGTTVRLYVDGDLVGTHAVTKSINWNTGYFGSFIGGNGVDPYNKFQGELDEVRLWTTARSQPQIRQFMRRRLAGNEPGLLACYRLDEGSGQTAVDDGPFPLNASLGLTGAAGADDPAWIASTAPGGLSDLAGNVLDGELPGALPSGNASAGGDFESYFFVIPRSDESCGLLGAELLLLLGAWALLRSGSRRR